MLNYLEKAMRLDISMATHQCACFCEYLMLLHEMGVKCIFCYLLGTKDKRLIFDIDRKKGLECYVDALTLEMAGY